MARVFLDLEIGDQNEAASQEAAHGRACSFFSAVRTQYGWPERLSDLDAEDQEVFLEAYDSDPRWGGQGPARVAPPDALVRGRLVIALDATAAPKACENFRCLCTGEKGKGRSSGKALHYKGLHMHRCVRGFCAQGGDVAKDDGSGGDSIYGGAFRDERGGLALAHDAAGIVGMANSGPHTNRSQFYITLAPAPQCDGKHVVLGRVEPSGLPLLRCIDEVAATPGGTPAVGVLIAGCGQL